MLTKTRSFEIKGGSRVYAGLSSALCTPHKTQSAGGSSTLTLPPWGQRNLHKETGFYITSRGVTSIERETRSIPNRPLEVLLPLGLSGRPRTTLGAIEEGQEMNTQERSFAHPSRGLLPVMEGEVPTALPYEVFHCSKVHIRI